MMTLPLYALGIHTTTGQLGLAISKNGQIDRHQVWQLDRNLSNDLHQLLQEFIPPQTWQDLSYLAVAKGPGSFTSTRIGVVTARILGQQLNIPVFAISTLAAYGWSQRHNYSENVYLPIQMKAVRDKVYGAIYQLDSHSSHLMGCVEDQVISPEQWQDILKDFNPQTPVLVTPDQLGETVISVLELAHQAWQDQQRPHWSEALPFYGHFS